MHRPPISMARFARVDPLTVRPTWESLAVHLLSGGRLFGRPGVVRTSPARPPTALGARVPLKPRARPAWTADSGIRRRQRPGRGVARRCDSRPANRRLACAPDDIRGGLSTWPLGFRVQCREGVRRRHVQYHATRDTFRIVRAVIEARGLRYDPVRTNCNAVVSTLIRSLGHVLPPPPVRG
jgi:hypothetical protein